MELTKLGMINATKLADPNLFNTFFGVGVDEFLKTTDPQPAEVIPYLWNEMPTDDCDFSWQAIRVPEFDYQTAIAPIPRAVELPMLTHRLLDAAGVTVSIPPRAIPYCGGLARFGAFQMEPRSTPILNRRRRLTPLEQLRAALSEEQYHNCDLTLGFAMSTHCHWMPHMWLTRADGMVFETAGHNSHFFGVKVPPDSINSIFWTGGSCN
jgi:hypothetical protein